MRLTICPKLKVIIKIKSLYTFIMCMTFDNDVAHFCTSFFFKIKLFHMMTTCVIRQRVRILLDTGFVPRIKPYLMPPQDGSLVPTSIKRSALSSLKLFSIFCHCAIQVCSKEFGQVSFDSLVSFLFSRRYSHLHLKNNDAPHQYVYVFDSSSFVCRNRHLRRDSSALS